MSEAKRETWYPIVDPKNGQHGWRLDFAKPIPLIQEIYDDIVTARRLTAPLRGLDAVLAR
jgi:hypothetical protein